MESNHQRLPAWLSGGIVLLTVAGLILLWSFVKQPVRPQDPVQQKAVMNYQKYCAGCHGEFLERFTPKPWMGGSDNTPIVKSITFGIETKGMPSFRKTFTDSEIESLATYVRKGIPADRSMLKSAATSGDVIESEVQNFVVETVISGLGVPWGLVFLPNRDLLISQREGKLQLFSNGVLSPPIGGLPPLMVGGQGGLLDLCLHPDYDHNGWIYISYSALDTTSTQRKGSTAIMRARLKNNRLTDQQVLFRATPTTTAEHHFGCKMAFDKQGHLFFGVGERGQHFVFPQKLDNDNGKIHRINDDGTIPADNPFVNTPGARPTIYSYGHRNPQGTCINPISGEIWETEHGPRGGDEINLIRPGLNYGWPVISYGINYDGTVLTPITSKEGMEQPLFYWTPSIAPCGMTFLTGDAYPNWKNNLLVGSLSFQYLERLVIDKHAVIHREKLLEGIGRVRNVVIGPKGIIYIGVENPGRILRLMPVESNKIYPESNR